MNQTTQSDTTQNETTQITPLDVLISGIYKAQSRGAYNLNEASILAKAVQHFGQRNMINPVIMKQINGETPQNTNVKQEETTKSEPVAKVEPEPVIKVEPETKPEVKPKPKVSITDDDLSEVYVIGNNKKKNKKSNLRMVIEDDEE